MPTAVTPTRRERKKHATRDAIHDAALSLTEELGLAGVTVEAISERADVAPRTFFNYFPSKVHAVIGGDPDRTVRVRDAIESRPLDESPLMTLRHVLLEDFLPNEPTADGLLRRFRVVRAEPTLLATLHAEFETTEHAMVTAIAGRTGHRDTDLYPALLVAVAVSALRVSLMRWSETGRGSIQSIVIEAFDHLTNGLVESSSESISL